jgi:hypothetical protein
MKVVIIQKQKSPSQRDVGVRRYVLEIVLSQSQGGVGSAKHSVWNVLVGLPEYSRPSIDIS